MRKIIIKWMLILLLFLLLFFPASSYFLFLFLLLIIFFTLQFLCFALVYKKKFVVVTLAMILMKLCGKRKISWLYFLGWPQVFLFCFVLFTVRKISNKTAPKSRAKNHSNFDRSWLWWFLFRERGFQKKLKRFLHFLLLRFLPNFGLLFFMNKINVGM